MDTTEAADLARIILDDSEADLPNDLYPLNVREARTLARAVIDLTDKLVTRDAQAERVEAQAQAWEAAASMIEAHGGDTETIRDMLQDLRTALKGDDA